MSDYRPVWESRGKSKGLVVSSAASVFGHAALLALVFLPGIGSCGTEATTQINYVSVISLPQGSLNAGGNPKNQTDVAPPPTPPPIADNSMTVPDSTPIPRASGQATPKSTPDARLAALDKARQDAARAEALKRLAAQNPGSGGTDTATGGNFGIEGGDWNAIPGAVPYEALVRATIEANWLPPTWVLEQKKNLICEVHIWVGFDGRITKRKLASKSGNTSYDQSALAAVDKTDRLPLPPEETREYLLKHGITLRFNPSSKR